MIVSEETATKIKNELLNMVSLVELISQPEEEEGAQETSTEITITEISDD